MSTLTKCDACGVPFDFVTAGVRHTEDGDYHVDYVTCPNCRKRWLMMTTDTEVREMVEKRRRLNKKIQIAKLKKYRPATIEKYIKEATELTAEAKEKSDALAGIGEEILSKL